MKLLLATDGSFHGTEAARFVAGLIANAKLDVNLLTVSFEPEEYASASIQPWLPEYRERETERVEQHHAELRRILTQSGASVTTLRKIGHPRRDILAEAERLGVDLIVMGARGRSTVGRLLLGSVSDDIATRAQCSVLIVRSQNGEHVQSPQNVMIAYDGSAGSREAIDELMELQLPKESIANIVSVVNPVDFYAHAIGVGETEEKEVEEKRLLGERIASQLANQLPHTDTQVVRGSHTGETIVLTAEENQADLIVVGETGHSLLGEWILGSTSKYVLRHAPCSVLISRHHRSATTQAKVSENAAAQ